QAAAPTRVAVDVVGPCQGGSGFSSDEIQVRDVVIRVTAGVDEPDLRDDPVAPRARLQHAPELLEAAGTTCPLPATRVATRCRTAVASRFPASHSLRTLPWMAMRNAAVRAPPGAGPRLRSAVALDRGQAGAPLGFGLAALGHVGETFVERGQGLVAPADREQGEPVLDPFGGRNDPAGARPPA